MACCVVCKEPTSLQCARCREVTYCSKPCQKIHWKVHKSVCGQLRENPCVKLTDMEDMVTQMCVQELRAESKECHCALCAKLCIGVPGAYDPEHVLQLATKDPAFYANCIQDFYATVNKSPSFYLRPRIVHETGGTRAPFFATRGNCSFLGPSGCTLERKEMPLGCVVARACVRGGPNADKTEATKRQKGIG